jgi:SAM-dependent methyltransferase
VGTFWGRAKREANWYWEPGSVTVPGNWMLTSSSFADRLIDLSNSGLLALMVSIGHRTGLFDAMATVPPATSSEIADRAGLNERYVREWLAAMTTGRIVAHDPREMTFTLPAELAAHLTRAAGAGNFAAGFQLLGALAAVEDRVVDCFWRGGGVPSSEFSRFQAICAELSWPALDAGLLQSVLPLVPGLSQRLHMGIDVAEVGCGWGHALNLMAESFPASRFVGWDASDEALAAGQAEAERKELRNVRFERRDATSPEVTESFDFIMTLDALHDQARPDLVLRGIAGAMRPEGTYLCVEIGASSTLADNLGLPWAAGMYAVSCMHCLPVSLASGGAGLGAMWGDQLACRLLAEAGFLVRDVKRLPSDPLNNYYIVTKGHSSDDQSGLEQLEFQVPPLGSRPHNNPMRMNFTTQEEHRA